MALRDWRGNGPEQRRGRPLRSRLRLVARDSLMQLEDIRPGIRLGGVTSGVVTVIQAEMRGDTAVTLTYRDEAGGLREMLLFRDDESRLETADATQSRPFTADPRHFLLAAEAERIRLAHLFDPYLAVHTSKIEPLPHQITAVYGAMLDRHPLRFLLADDPGAGKTIMAGLLIKELLIRGDLERCLVVAPGSLVEQWQDELGEKFDLDFAILTRDLLAASRRGDPFSEHPRLIARLDMLSRGEDLQHLIRSADEWDLVICDEAHRMSAGYFGAEVKYTKRYQLGRLLRDRARHFLLMTATPHNGKEEDFQLFLALLDPDRFEGRFRPGVHSRDASDVLRRLTKEELRRFDGTALFPERRAYTAQYELSEPESALYETVTRYVQEEMNRAERFAATDERRRVNVGFALTVLQRRLASSPAAIHESLKRRLARMEDRLTAIREGGPPPAFSTAPDPEELEEATETEIEAVEERVLDQATAAATIEDLETEIATLARLEKQARGLRRRETDTKWRELHDVLDHPLMTDQHGKRRKLIVFTEPRDTLEYLAERIRTRLGKPDGVVVIHGGVSREARREAVEAFMNDPEVVVMVANDAAGEGVNLQRAHLMVNYDLPWNPNRLEQRFGRIHRIGQTEVCHLWNLVAKDTREGAVYARLLEKLDVARKALGGRVYDVLGRLFEGRAMRDLLLDAIRYGESPEARNRLFEKVDQAAAIERVGELLTERALVREHLSPATISEIRDQMARASARRLQPHFIRRFFLDAFRSLGGSVHRREQGRFEITRVPRAVRDLLPDRVRAGRPGAAVPPRYERIAFERRRVTGPPPAAFVCPGHPLLDRTLAAVLDRWGTLLAEGALLVDEADERREVRAVFALRSAVSDGRTTRSGARRTISERLDFVEVERGGAVRNAGPAPHLDCRPIRTEERSLLGDRLNPDWLDGDEAVMDYAVGGLVPEHLAEVRQRREAEIEKTRQQVFERLSRERTHWDNRANELRARERAGKPGRIAAEQAARRAEELDARLARRMEELDREGDLAAAPPRVVGVSLVAPGGLLRELAAPLATAVASPEGRAEVEQIAMETVMAAERRLGRTPRDVSAEKCGYDIESRDLTTGRLRFLEVKGRRADAETVTVTRNETLVALNSRDQAHDYILAVVLVEQGYAQSTAYVTDPFRTGVDDTTDTVTHTLKKLLARATPPA